MRPRVQIALIGTIGSLLSAFFFLKWQAPIRGWILGSLGAGFLISGLLIPPAAEAIQRALKALTVGIVLVLSWILLGSVYFLVIVPLGWVLRRTGSLRTRRAAPRGDSYWADRKNEPLSVGRYLRSF
ncbi:MAG TPA: hypothetical protein VJU16_01890 [Planctomycetota bacterium]|nr:hypothetical protein [Planctomycetota bacterium]